MLLFLWYIIPRIYCLQYTYINYEEEDLPPGRVNTFTSRVIDPRNVAYLVYPDKQSLSECILDFCGNQTPCYIQVEYKNSLYVCTLFIELLSDMGALVPSYDVSGITKSWVFTKEQILCSGYCTHLGSDYLCGSQCQCIDSCGPSYYPFYCKCNVGEKPVLSSCAAIRQAGYNVSGLYDIRPNPHHPSSMEVFCDLSNRNARILLFQRFDLEPSSHVFNRTDYTKSFGQPDSAYFLGLENIHHITEHISVAVKTKVYANDNQWKISTYESIKVGSGSEKYLIKLTSYTGDAETFSPFGCNSCHFHQYTLNGYTYGWWVGYAHLKKPTSKSGIQRHVKYKDISTVKKMQVWLVERF